MPCWAYLAHVRRKFFELHAANKSWGAAEALAAIARLYQIERQAADMSAQARQALRMNEAKPLLDAWHVWLIESAKLSGHDPFAYLRDVLTRLPTHPYRRIDELLPFNWTPADSYSM